MRKIIRRAAAVLLSAALLLAGTASAAAQIDPVEERLAAMSLREKVGQLFVVRVEALDPSGQSDSTRLTWAERQGLKKYPVGGIVVFRQNVKSPEQLKKLLADFQAASGTGLLTAVDEEGPGSRYNRGPGQCPCHGADHRRLPQNLRPES